MRRLLPFISFFKYELLAVISFFTSRFKIYHYAHSLGCSISLDAVITGPLRDCLYVGSGTRINGLFNLRAKSGKLTIGNNCLIARNVTIIVNTYDLNKSVSIHSMVTKDVFIGDHCLIGSHKL